MRRNRTRNRHTHEKEAEEMRGARTFWGPGSANTKTRKAMSTTMLFSLLLGGATSLARAQEHSCYALDGTSMPTGEGGWHVCNPEATKSTCCSWNDYCASNGLCMNAYGNNWWAVQGCTDAGWDGCTSYCDASELSSDLKGYVPVWICGRRNEAGFTTYCCGRDASCCNDTDNKSIQIATSLYRPGAHASTSTSSSSSTSSPTANSDTVSAADASSSPTSDSELTKYLGIGLGVGIPLLVALIGSLIFFGCQARKRNKQLEAANAAAAARSKEGGGSGSPGADQMMAAGAGGSQHHPMSSPGASSSSPSQLHQHPHQMYPQQQYAWGGQQHQQQGGWYDPQNQQQQHTPTSMPPPGTAVTGGYGFPPTGASAVGEEYYKPPLPPQELPDHPSVHEKADAPRS